MNYLICFFNRGSDLLHEIKINFMMLKLRELTNFDKLETKFN